MSHETLAKLIKKIVDESSRLGNTYHTSGIDDARQLEAVLDKHEAVFAPCLGQFKDTKIQMDIDPQAKPTFCKARPCAL